MGKFISTARPSAWSAAAWCFFMAAAQAAPPLGLPPAGGGRHSTPSATATAAAEPTGQWPGSATETETETETAPPPAEGWPGNTQPTGTPDEQTLICTPPAVQVAPKTCASPESKDQIDAGLIRIDENGNISIAPPPSWNPVTGQFGTFNAATQACNPAIEVKLKQAALAGSQLTRAISDKQLSYPQTDPIEAVNNAKKDGAGGVCTIDIFAFDLGRLLGDTYAQIKNLIDMLSNFSIDSLFGAACKVMNSIFGNMQNQLLNELQTNSPLSQFQQFVNQLTVGYVSPLASFVSYGAGLRPTTAAVPGVTSLNPLQVSYVPGKGYVYMADVGSGNFLVVNISQTPLSPADAVTPAPAPAAR